MAGFNSLVLNAFSSFLVSLTDRSKNSSFFCAMITLNAIASLVIWLTHVILVYALSSFLFLILVSS